MYTIPVILSRGAAGAKVFSKTLVLMPSNTCRRVPMGQEKLKLYLSKYILDAVEIPLDKDEISLKEHFGNIFRSKLGSSR